MADTVLIADPENQLSFLEQGDFGDALFFSDTDTLKALEASIRERPRTIALDEVFAATSRGTALINRIKADPALRACVLRIMSHASVSPGTPEATPGAPSPPGHLDQRGTRRAPRYLVLEGVEASIDGTPVTLVDVSMVGAQVLSPKILRPNQRARMVIAVEAEPIRAVATVAWSSFELPASGPRYRAGIEFYDADVDAMERFIARRGTGELVQAGPSHDEALT